MIIRTIYRGITIVSCFGKLFTSNSNTRLQNFSDEINLLNENEVVFRRGCSTLDHPYVLRLICDLFLSKNLKLYCCFIDYAKAFDSVWRDGLWLKLLKSGKKGNKFC